MSLLVTCHRSLVTFLFCSQGLHRIDPGGAERGDETRQSGDGADKKGDTAVEPWVARTHFEEQSLHETCGGEGETESDHKPDH